MGKDKNRNNNNQPQEDRNVAQQQAADNLIGADNQAAVAVGDDAENVNADGAVAEGAVESGGSAQADDTGTGEAPTGETSDIAAATGESAPAAEDAAAPVSEDAEGQAVKEEPKEVIHVAIPAPDSPAPPPATPEAAAELDAVTELLVTNLPPQQAFTEAEEQPETLSTGATGLTDLSELSQFSTVAKLIVAQFDEYLVAMHLTKRHEPNEGALLQTGLFRTLNTALTKLDAEFNMVWAHLLTKVAANSVDRLQPFYQENPFRFFEEQLRLTPAQTKMFRDLLNLMSVTADHRDRELGKKLINFTALFSQLEGQAVSNLSQFYKVQ